MEYFGVSDEATAQLSKDEFGSGKAKWLKMTLPGEYVLRLLPPWSEEGSFARKLITHNEPYGRSLKLTYTNDEGEKNEITVAPVCLDYIFNNPVLKKIALEREALTSKDEKLFKVYGCPLDILPRQLRKSNQYDRKVHAGYWGRTQIIFNVLLISGPQGSDEEVGRVYKWSVSKSKYEDMEAFILRSNIFVPSSNKDLLIKATGPKDKTRRYSSPQFIDGDTLKKLTKDIDELPNLDDDFIKGVRNFETLVEILKNNRLDWPAEYRLGDLSKFIKTGR
jgi:hypothetical protein